MKQKLLWKSSITQTIHVFIVYVKLMYDFALSFFENNLRRSVFYFWIVYFLRSLSHSIVKGSRVQVQKVQVQGLNLS